MKHFVVPVLFFLVAIGVLVYNSTTQATTLSISFFGSLFPGDPQRQGWATVGVLVLVGVITGVRGILRAQAETD